MILDELPKPAQRRLDAFKRAASRFCDLINKSGRYDEIELLRRLELGLVDLLATGHRLPTLDPWADEPDDDDEGDNDEVEIAPTSEISLTKWIREAQEQPRLQARLADYYRVRELLEPRFDGYNYYLKTFDPYSPEPRLRKQLTASLTDDLAETYAFVKDEERKDALPADEREPPYERLWHWKFDYDEHIALYHVLPALTAVTFLLRDYWDNDDGWSEMWQPDSASDEPQAL